MFIATINFEVNTPVKVAGDDGQLLKARSATHTKPNGKAWTGEMIRNGPRIDTLDMRTGRRRRMVTSFLFKLCSTRCFADFEDWL